MADTVSINAPAAPGLPPRSIAAPTQKTAKEQADANRANLANNTYLDAIRSAAYGAPTGQTKNPFTGEVINTYDTTTQKYLGIPVEAQRFGHVAYTAPARPADNAPEAAWQNYNMQTQRAIRPPLYQVGSQYQTFENMDQNKIRQYQQAFSQAGLYPKGVYHIPGRASTYDYQIMESLMGEANMSGLSWEDVLKVRAGAKAGKFGGGGGTTSSTSTQISYTQTSIANGRALLKQTLGNAIGRAPSDAELTRYMKMVHDAESNSPTRTVTTSTRSAGGSTSVSRTTPSNVDTADMALDFAKQVGGGDPYRERQASHYLDLIMNRGGVGSGA